MKESKNKEQKGDPNIELVEVFTAYGETNAQVIRSMLESDGIESILRGEAVRLTHGITVDGLAEVKIVVRKEDEARAKEVIAAFVEKEQ